MLADFPHTASHHWLPHDAEDLTGEVFLAVCKHGLPENPEAYALAVARNLVNRYYKDETKSPQAVAALATNKGRAVKDRRHARPVSVKQFKKIISDLDVHLSPKAYEAIKLRFVVGLSTEEAAQRIGCSQAALKKRLQRAKRALKKSIRSRR